MAKKKSIVPGVEILIIIVFLISFLVWALPKCAATKSKIQQKEMTKRDSVEDKTDKTLDSIAANLVTAGGSVAGLVDSAKKAIKQKIPAPVVTNRSILYITIDNLKLRKSPHLDSVVVATLPLFEEVYFMNEVTDFTQQISLGYEITEEPWVKVRTKKGKDGWVYGAGVHYYKKKRTGVLE